MKDVKLTEAQIKFLDGVCKGTWNLNSNGEVDVDGSVSMIGMNLTEIPVKFGNVGGSFICTYNQLTSLKFAPTSVGGDFSCGKNQLTSLEFSPTYIKGDFTCTDNQLKGYFKNIKDEDFLHWGKLHWFDILEEYPFLINICKNYFKSEYLKYYLNTIPQTKLYLE